MEIEGHRAVQPLGYEIIGENGDEFHRRSGRLFLVTLWLAALVYLILPPVSFALTLMAGDLAPRGNPDSQISAADVNVLQRFVLQETTPTAEELLVGDVAPLGNPDGVLNMADVLVLQRAVLGLVTLPPIIIGPPAPADASKIELMIGNGVVTVIGAAGSVQPNSTVTISNPWRETADVIVTANADGSFSATIVARLGDKLVITVSNSSGQASTPTNIGVMKIAITAPKSGITVYGANSVGVQGTVLAPSYANILVNGDYPDVSGTVFSSIAYLNPGTNTITASVSASGLSTSYSITVTSLPETSSPVQITVNPLSGLAPLAVQFTAQSSGPSLQRLQIDYDSDGQTDYDSSVQGVPATNPITESYPDPGIYDATVTVTDSQGNIHVSVHTITVGHPKDAMLRGIYENMMENLRNGNIDGAVAAFSGSSQEKYRAIFTTLQSDLSTIVNQFGTLDSGLLGDDWAEYVLLREENGESHAYLINFLRGEDGVWRIDGM
jgi:hypothetical protein